MTSVARTAPGDAEPGQLRRAEVADDRGVGEQEQRLGDEGAERGDGEPEDLAVLQDGARGRLVGERGAWQYRRYG